jgi:hypothetical protein
METIIYAIIKVTIQSELPKEQAIADVEQNAQYIIPSTERSTIVDTEWVASTNYHP